LPVITIIIPGRKLPTQSSGAATSYPALPCSRRHLMSSSIANGRSAGRSSTRDRMTTSAHAGKGARNRTIIANRSMHFDDRKRRARLSRCPVFHRRLRRTPHRSQSSHFSSSAVQSSLASRIHGTLSLTVFPGATLPPEIAGGRGRSYRRAALEVRPTRARLKPGDFLPGVRGTKPMVTSSCDALRRGAAPAVRHRLCRLGDFVRRPASGSSTDTLRRPLENSSAVSPAARDVNHRRAGSVVQDTNR